MRLSCASERDLTGLGAIFQSNNPGVLLGSQNMSPQDDAKYEYAESSTVSTKQDTKEWAFSN